MGAGRALGLDDDNDREEPVELPALRGVPIVQVACGKHHTMALSADGEVWAWGAGKYGELGNGTPSSTLRPPERVAALSGKGVRQLAVGHYHSAAVLDDGSLLTWGYNGSFLSGEGGLGHGTWKSTALPTPVPGFGPAGERVISVSCGGYHSIALTADGQAHSWGRGEGRLGHGGPAGYKSPLRIEQLVGLELTQVFASEKHSACLCTRGRRGTARGGRGRGCG
jgi:alpha-tubulin suppressor-like RCC1 family protein